MKTTFIVLGPPIPKGRGRVAISGGIGGAPLGVHVRTPQATKSYEHHVKSTAKIAHNDKPLFKGPMRVTCEFRMPIPESWPQGKKMAAAEGMIYHTSKPDIDNLTKAVFDACNGTVWCDDQYIVSKQCDKVYHVEPCAIVTVELIEELD